MSTLIAPSPFPDSGDDWLNREYGADPFASTNTLHRAVNASIRRLDLVATFVPAISDASAQGDIIMEAAYMAALLKGEEFFPPEGHQPPVDPHFGEVRCPDCGGKGCRQDSPLFPCGTCRGRGYVRPQLPPPTIDAEGWGS